VSFWLLHGFKEENQLRETLQSVPEFNFLLPVFEKEGYKGLYKEVMEYTQDKTDEVLAPLVKRELSKKNELSKDQAGYWVCKLYEKGQEIKDIDRGIFSIYFFNIVEVQPGEAVFQGAGIPHAYLEGQNVELMANSDNVLRGGLTPKHIDVAELMKHTTFEGVTPDVMKGEDVNEIEKRYPCPIADFGISLIETDVDKIYSHETSSAEIYLIVLGAVEITRIDMKFKKGEAFFVPPSTKISLESMHKARLYKSFVPNADEQ
jgi:mannose-6-phosphate isomerase